LFRVGAASSVVEENITVELFEVQFKLFDQEIVTDFYLLELQGFQQMTCCFLDAFATPFKSI
jgi:hypothetical protein